MNTPLVSIVIPARDEAKNIVRIIRAIRATHSDTEIIVVNDGSTDDTPILAAAEGAQVVSHPYTMGNGAAIKSGARAARGHTLVFMDGDGQHDPEDIPRLLARLGDGFDMVVGARDADGQASWHRRLANWFYNRLATAMTGHRIADLTSGFRAVRADRFRRFLYLLPNGFSYPTTSTMAFFRSGFPVAYVPIRVSDRTGRSKIRLLRDGIRFFVIILKIGTLFSPMRLFLPVSALFFLTGLGYYSYTFATMNRFTNMSALLFIASMLAFLMGILSEQVSSLHYKDVERDRHE